MWIVGLLGLVALVLIAAQMGMLAGQRPTDLGVTDGRLKPPSPTRNSVSSQADLYPDHPQRAYATIPPLPLKNGDADASFRALEKVLGALTGVTIVERKPGYIRAEAETKWLKFVDDVEFWLPPERRAIEVRSASRLGREDMGVNRKRMEAIRQAYLAQP